MEQVYDAVVIGSGMGGLAAGCSLAHSGLSVLMLEQHNIPGGVTTSFKRGRFEFEISVQCILEYGSKQKKGPIRKFLADDLRIDIDFPLMDEGRFCTLTDNDEQFVLPLQKEKLIAFIEQRVPGSEPSVRAYLDFCDEMLAAIDYINEMDAKIKPVELIMKHRSIVAASGLTVREVTDRFRIPAKALEYLDVYWTFIGLPMEVLSFPIYGTVVSGMSTTPVYTPRKTTFEISAKMAQRFIEMGGHLSLNTRADKILVDKGRVTGVVTNRGETVQTQHVYANALPHNVFNHMIYPKSEIPENALKALGMRVAGTSFLSMYMGLDRSAEELGLKHYMYYFAKNGNISAMYDGIGELTPNDCFAGMCPNPLIADASPQGTCILHLETLYRSEPWGQLSDKDYFKKKHELAGDLIDRASKALHVPIRPHIEEIEVAAPQTFARYTGSFMGNVYGYDHRVFDSVVIKAMMQKKERFVEGLSIVGNAGLLVAGFPSSILSGRLATIEQIAHHNAGRREAHV